MERIADGFKGEKAIVTPYNIRNYQAGNEITQQLYVTHIGYYPHARYHYRQREHGTPEYVFIYCEEGNGWVEYEGEHYELHENQAFILPPDKAHAYGAGKSVPWSIYWFHFCGNNCGIFSSIFGKVVNFPDADNSRFRDRFRMFEEMFQNLEMGYSPENLEYVSFCLMHFLASVKYLNQYREISRVKEADVIQKSIHYMKDHLEKKITAHDIAVQAGYSLSHFTALFKTKTSYSPMEYYNQLKIQRACSYLQFSDLQLKEIAFRLGFCDPFHFSNAFKQEMGITPKEYRKNIFF